MDAFAWHFTPAEQLPLPWTDGSVLIRQPNSAKVSASGLEYHKCLRTLLAHISLLLTPPHLSLQFLHLLEATAVATSPRAKVYSATPEESKMKDLRASCGVSQFLFEQDPERTYRN